MNDGHPRLVHRTRKTQETDCTVSLQLDGTGQTAIATGFGMLDHMLTLLFFWAGMDCTLSCKGDLVVDAHHSVEDCGLLLGAALHEALGEKRGIARVGYGRVPMDEALAEVSLDMSGRPWLEWRGDDILPPVIAREEKDVWREFAKAMASSGRFTLHVSFLYGKNGHHLLESAFKGFGLALASAVRISGDRVRSTKGGLE